ncbi:CBM96 family carbohydrate-binding protein [Dyadobacter sandarakinus]|uniref:DNRLRE domain-containing protein n=1 Tax=Dyadobacter sandarakinus TaxID=2747268 RepID=A0ABX7I405_9BACT|nr:malectin domain-containing carbohydrate-binding protein [Dyadobacter sandarakinus]QRR00821.1 DNRLRE domain-containing protein [Dyadobacter sandarakinus]
MQKILQIALLLAFSTIPAWSQTCSVATFQTQAEIDNFSTSYPGCTVLNGNVGIVSTNITNLDGLRNVTRINGRLNIDHNPYLVSIAGLSSLEQLDGSLNIEDNDNLLTLAGLEKLVRPLQRISVVNNEKLTSITALSGVTRMYNSLSISGNPALTSLEGLHNVSTVFKVVSIKQNDMIRDLNGLRRLKEVDYLYVVNNRNIKNLKGLARLESVNINLEITGNGALTSISELAELKFTNSVTITNNPLLSDCAVRFVCEQVASSGNIRISGNAAGCSNNVEVRLSATCTPQTLMRINAGGPAFTTATQKLFVADQYYAGIDRTSSIASGDILNTTNDVLYRSGRCSPSFSYNIPVVNELVNVTLHFAETYFGAPGKKGGAGSRQFNVDIEGSRKLTNYDIFAEAGGALRAVQLTIPVRVTDGMLNIDFLTGAADLPRVSAIEVTASPTLSPVADGMANTGKYSNTNYGFAKYLDVNRYLNPGPTYLGDALTYIKFQLPAGKAEITSAKLRIYGDTYVSDASVDIHAYGVNDDSWTEGTLTGNNAPAASTSSLGFMTVNDVSQYREIDVTSYVNAQRQSGDVLVSFMLDDPNITSIPVTVNSKESGAQEPQLVYQTTPIVQAQNGIARIGQEEVITEVQEKQHSTIFPNPVKDQFIVSLSPEHAGSISFEMVNAAGKSRSIPAPQNIKPGENTELNIAGQSFHPGLYLLKVKSDAFTEAIKVLVAE